MAQHLSIPIRFRFLKYPVTWETRAHHRNDPSVIPCMWGEPGTVQPDSKVLSELDGWLCRKEFLSIRKNDTDALRDFLNNVGAYSTGSDPDFLPHTSMEIYVDHFWQFQETLTCGLLTGKIQQNWLSQIAPAAESPKTLIDFWLRYPGNKFPLRFELPKSGRHTKVGVITTTNAFHMLLATVLVDIARGIRSKVCQRKDCHRIFPIESKHKRRYCSQYCGHLESIRRMRRKALNRPMK